MSNGARSPTSEWSRDSPEAREFSYRGTEDREDVDPMGLSCGLTGDLVSRSGVTRGTVAT